MQMIPKEDKFYQPKNMYYLEPYVIALFWRFGNTSTNCNEKITPTRVNDPKIP